MLETADHKKSVDQTGKSDTFAARNTALRCVFREIGDAKTLAACECVSKHWKLVLDGGNFVSERCKVDKITFCMSNNVETITCLHEKLCDFSTNVEEKVPSKTKMCLLPHFELFRSKSEEQKFSTLKFLIPPVQFETTATLLLTRLSKKFKVSRGVGFVNCTVSNAMLRLVPKFGRKLRQIRFLRCFINEKALSALKPLRFIKEFALDQCVGCKDSISNDALIPLLQGNSLQILELAGAQIFDKLDDALIRQLLRMLRIGSFECLKLANCPKISTDAIGNLANYFMDKKQGRFVIFLDKMPFFDSNYFLNSQRTFSRDCSIQSTQRVRLNSGNCTIWLETKDEK
uniref:Uncharacterized protein n=1 Tax=Romanomermis culicivorax TaxID=13658 RepID=A0A915JLB0_ROMCU